MEVVRRIEQLVGHRVVLDLPECFDDRCVEVIVLTLDHYADPPKMRRPHPPLAGTMTYDDDLFDSIPFVDAGRQP